jgi:type IV pilus assembly protein PilQ
MLKRASSLVILMVVAASVPMAWSDVPAVPGSATASVPQANLSTDTGLVSLDFQDADIRNVLKVLAFKSGVNIVAAPEVTGVVNIELKDVPWQKALDVILSTYGYGFDRKGNIITVMSVENLKKYREDTMALENQESLVSKTYSLNYAKAEDLMKIIDKLVSKRGFMNFDARTNSIIVRDLQNNLDLISEVIKSIDTITPQVMIETKIIETDLDDTENLGVDWTVVSHIADSSQHPLIKFSTSNYSTASLVSSTATPSSSLGLTYGTINGTQLTSILQLLSTRSTTKVLSNPRIVTLDNQKATINVGLEYPVPSYSFNSSTGQEQVTGFSPLSIGVNFEVTPHVNNAGMVTLELHPQISALQATITVQNNPFPETSTEEAETNVMVEDGKTLVIGGLITDQVNVTKTKIPVLGDIPWLGDMFFKSSSTVKARKEVLIFLTPHIIIIGKDPASDTTP